MLDVARQQGEHTARVRGGQLEGDRAHLAAVTGTPWDDVARRLLVEETARHALTALDDEAQEFFAAFAEGVNRGLSASVRLSDEPWQPWTPLGIFHVNHVLFGALGHHLWRRHVARTLGPAAVRALAHEVPAVSGSNAWVVGGARTADGAPLIAADPHRLLHFPGVYQPVHLVCPEFDVVGLTLPGVPGVQHFGHTGSVAWSITNAMADTQDLIDVLLRNDGLAGGVEADLGDGWEPAELIDGVVRTRLGPVLVGSPDEGAGVVVRSAVHVARDLGLGAVLPLLRSSTAADVDAALDQWVDPVNDVLIADQRGTVLHRVAGRVPRRVAGDWLGWVQHRTEVVADDGHVVSANHRRGPESDALAVEFAPPHRAQRLEELVGSRSGWTVEAAAHTLYDTVLPTAPTWQERLASVEVSDVAEDLRLRLLTWNGRMDAESADAALFAAVRGALVRRLTAEPALAGLRQPSGLPEMFGPWLRPEPRIALALDRWLAEGAPFGLDLTALLASALEDVAASGHPATWGDAHRIVTADGTRVPVGGDEGCVLSTSSLPGLDDTCWRAPVARVVWSLADRRDSRWVVPDDLQAWLSGALRPVEEPMATTIDPAAFTMRPVDPDTDAPLLHRWVTQERAQFWGMTEKSVDEVRGVYAFLDTLDSHHAYLVLYAGRPAAIFQTYEPQHDPVGELYAVQDGDLGVHLFMAEGERVPGFTGALFGFALSQALLDPGVLRLLGEPDVLNDKSRALAERLGAEEGPEIDLGWKRARLFFLPRDAALTVSGAFATE